MNLKTIDGNPEFGLELTLTLPHAYYLHNKNLLEKVITVKGMKPFYYFFDNVEERYNHRSVDNNLALKDVPNKWIHHNALAITGKDYNQLSEEEKSNVNGVLDYTEWDSPPIKKYYSENNEINLSNKFVVICNKFNVDHAGDFPFGYFDINILQEIYGYLIERGYDVVYKRPEMTEFVIDINEQITLEKNLLKKYGIKAQDENGNIVDDKQLSKLYKNVYLFDDLILKYPNLSYNEFQLKLFSKAHGFISIGGGNSILCCLFSSPVISYFTTNREMRNNYFNKNCYYRKLSDNDFYPIKDSEDSIMKNGHNYKELLDTIKNVY